MSQLQSISPLDGRYQKILTPLRKYLSEEALIYSRVKVEINYLLALIPVLRKADKTIPSLSSKDKASIKRIADSFSGKDASRVKTIEKTTNHDVKAVEYFLREKFKKNRTLSKFIPFIHFGLTSEDVNNLAYNVLLTEAVHEVVLKDIRTLQLSIKKYGKKTEKVTMLSLTHGQPATPTTLGKELFVFAERLERQITLLEKIKLHGKFGGAVGNYSAHKAAFPGVSWNSFGNAFVKLLKLEPLRYTTQINPHDDVALLSNVLRQTNVVLLDFSRDMWLYISRGVFVQKPNAKEVGSSTMPHKVNPIDFENAEGNLGLSSALFTHFSEKLPQSRLQRDLSDSTLQRNLGVAFGHHLLAVLSLQKGFAKLTHNEQKLREELNTHPEVLAEAIQTILRKKGDENAYEKLKAFTRGKEVTLQLLKEFMLENSFSKAEMSRVLKILQ